MIRIQAMKPYATLCLCAMLVCSANAVSGSQTASPSVSTSVSKASVQVAEPFWLEWSVSTAEGAKVIFPSIGAQVGEFDVMDTRDLFDIPGDRSADERIWTRRLKLDSVVAGDLEIPSIEIQVADNGAARVVKTQPVAMRVVSVLEDRSDPTQFRDIQSVVDVPIPQPTSHMWMWWTLGGSFGLALACTSLVVVRRRKKWLTPAQWVLQELEQLHESVAMESSGGDLAMTELSSVIREFLELQFSLDESGETGSELLEVLASQQRVDQATSKQLGALFDLADSTKFARIPLSSMELASAIQDARSIVERVAHVTNSQMTSDARETH